MWAAIPGSILYQFVLLVLLLASQGHQIDDRFTTLDHKVSYLDLAILESVFKPVPTPGVFFPGPRHQCAIIFRYRFLVMRSLSPSGIAGVVRQFLICTLNRLCIHKSLVNPPSSLLFFISTFYHSISTFPITLPISRFQRRPLYNPGKSRCGTPAVDSQSNVFFQSERGRTVLNSHSSGLL
jgi:hypothetical protein